MSEAFGNERRIALVRELTKLHEEVVHTTLGEANSLYEDKSPRGEYVLVVEGAKEVENAEEQWWENLSVNEHVEKYIEDGIPVKDAIKKVATDRNLPKRDVYNEYHGI